MLYDHHITTIHQAELDREIDLICTERLLARAGHGPGWAERARNAAGRHLIAAGTALIGSDRGQGGRALRTHRA